MYLNLIIYNLTKYKMTSTVHSINIKMGIICSFDYFFVGDTILNNLLDWIKIHYEKAENQAISIIEDKTAYYTDERVEEKFPFYWDAVIGLILQGNVDLVRMLLSNHSQSNTEPYIQAMKILKSMPTYSVSKFELNNFYSN